MLIIQFFPYYLVISLPPYVDAAYYPLIGEVLVVLVEALILTRLLRIGCKVAITCSFSMNLASFVLGLSLL